MAWYNLLAFCISIGGAIYQASKGDMLMTTVNIALACINIPFMVIKK